MVILRSDGPFEVWAEAASRNLHPVAADDFLFAVILHAMPCYLPKHIRHFARLTPPTVQLISRHLISFTSQPFPSCQAFMIVTTNSRLTYMVPSR